jgi:hypothetical protein
MIMAGCSAAACPAAGDVEDVEATAGKVEGVDATARDRDFAERRWWARYLSIYTIFVYAATTRIPFAIASVYGVRSLGMPQGLAVLALGAFSVGRATAASTIVGLHQAGLMKVVLSLTTAGYVLLGTVIGPFFELNPRASSADADLAAEPGVPRWLAFASYFFVLFLIGLSESVTALDFMVKRELRPFPREEQQRAMRLVLVWTGLGSAAAFATAHAYDAVGISAVSAVGAVMSLLHTAMVAYYFHKRGDGEESVNRGALEQEAVVPDGERTLAEPTGPPLWTVEQLKECVEKLQHLDTEEDKDKFHHEVLQLQAQLWTRGQHRQNRTFLEDDALYLDVPHKQPHADAVAVCENYLNLVDAVCLDRGLHSPDEVDLTTVEVEPRFSRQMWLMQWACVFWLGCGAVNISNIIAVFALFWTDVWNGTAGEASDIMILGEFCGYVALYLSQLLSTCTESGRGPAVLLKQPYFQWCSCVIILLGSAIIGFWKPTLAEAAARSGPFGAHVLSAVLLQMSNAVLHSSGTENLVLFLPKECFPAALKWGYTLKRFTNSGWAFFAAALVNWCSPYEPYVAVFLFYGVLYVPLQLWMFGSRARLLPFQRKRQDEALLCTLREAWKEDLSKTLHLAEVEILQAHWEAGDHEGQNQWESRRSSTSDDLEVVAAKTSYAPLHNARKLKAFRRHTAAKSRELMLSKSSLHI